MNILREAEREVWVDGTIYQFKSKVEASGFEDMCRAIGKLHNALQLYAGRHPADRAARSLRRSLTRLSRYWRRPEKNPRPCGARVKSNPQGGDELEGRECSR